MLTKPMGQTMESSDCPSAQASTIRVRCTTPWDSERERALLSAGIALGHAGFVAKRADIPKPVGLH